MSSTPCAVAPLYTSPWDAAAARAGAACAADVEVAASCLATACDACALADGLPT